MLMITEKKNKFALYKVRITSNHRLGIRTSPHLLDISVGTVPLLVKGAWHIF